MGLLTDMAIHSGGSPSLRKPCLLFTTPPSFRNAPTREWEHPSHFKIVAMDIGINTVTAQEPLLTCSFLWRSTLQEGVEIIWRKPSRERMFPQNWKGWRAMIWWRKCEAILGVWNFLWKGSNIVKKNEQADNCWGGGECCLGTFNEKNRSETQEVRWS